MVKGEPGSVKTATVYDALRAPYKIRPMIVEGRPIKISKQKVSYSILMAIDRLILAVPAEQPPEIQSGSYQSSCYANPSVQY